MGVTVGCLLVERWQDELVKEYYWQLGATTVRELCIHCTVLC